MIRGLLEEMPEGPVLLLENTSGSGGNLCGDLEELRGMLDLVDAPGRIGACLDTAHAHGYGYPLDTPDQALAFCRMSAGLFAGYPLAFHLNDSKAERGSRSDRHQSPGLGAVGVASLASVQSFEAFAGLPGVLETPGDDSDRLKDLRRILEFPQH
jgi:deoxyribonuclease-4